MACIEFMGENVNNNIRILTIRKKKLSSETTFNSVNKILTQKQSYFVRTLQACKHTATGVWRLLYKKGETFVHINPNFSFNKNSQRISFEMLSKVNTHKMHRRMSISEGM